MNKPPDAAFNRTNSHLLFTFEITAAQVPFYR